MTHIWSPRDTASLRNELAGEGIRVVQWKAPPALTPSTPESLAQVFEFPSVYLEADDEIEETKTFESSSIRTESMFDTPAPIDKDPGMEEAYGEFDFDQFDAQRTDILNVARRHQTFVREFEGINESD